MDMLSWLGTRAVGTASAVKPIITPLFLARAPVVEDTAAAEAFDQPADVPARSRFDGPDSRAEERHADVNTHVRVPAADVPKRHEPESEHDMVSLSPVDPPRSTSDGMPDLLPQRPLTERHLHGRAHSVEVASPAAGPRARVVSPQRDEASRQMTAPGSESVAALPTASALAPRVPREATASDIAAALERLRALRATGSARRTRRDPVVRVSIGRIEVRSTPAAAPEPIAPQPPMPAPARAVPPRLTLGEYLARQRGAR